MICVDVTDLDVVRAEVEKLRPIHMLVNNAALGHLKPFTEITPEEYDRRVDDCDLLGRVGSLVSDCDLLGRVGSLVSALDSYVHGIEEVYCNLDYLCMYVTQTWYRGN